MSRHKFIPSQTAVLIVDLQNDFLHSLKGHMGALEPLIRRLQPCPKRLPLCSMLYEALTAGSFPRSLLWCPEKKARLLSRHI